MDVVTSIENLANFKDVLQDVFCNIYNRNTTTSLMNVNIMDALKEDVKNLLLTCKFDKTHIVKCMNDKGWNDDKIKCFITVFEEHRSNLLYHTLINHNASYNESVINFDWNLKLVLGSSELKGLRYPLMQLAFSTRTPSEQEDNFGCELNKYMLEKLIDVLESALK